jgi:hypothetical protein
VGDAVTLGNIFGAPIEEVRFARDSPLEGAVSSEPVSIVEFPSAGDKRPRSREKKAKQPHASNPRNNRCAAGKAAASKALDVIPS